MGQDSPCWDTRDADLAENMTHIAKGRKGGSSTFASYNGAVERIYDWINDAASMVSSQRHYFLCEMQMWLCVYANWIRSDLLPLMANGSVKDSRTSQGQQGGLDNNHHCFVSITIFCKAKPNISKISPKQLWFVGVSIHWCEYNPVNSGEENSWSGTSFSTSQAFG